MSRSAQQYCLRWNNHRSNLLTVFDELLQNEAFTDVTLACDGGASVKCHKMVLAACSPYFQTLFTELPCRHPVVVLKDVRYGEMKAILEYMYRGEVNVAQDQLAALLKVAEALKVKGLVEENHRSSGASSTRGPGSSGSCADYGAGSQHAGHGAAGSDEDARPATAPRHGHHSPHHRPHQQHSPPTISTSGGNVQSAAHSSSGGASGSGLCSPPHSTASLNGPTTYGGGGSGAVKSLPHYGVYGGKPAALERGSRLGLPMWAVPGLPLPPQGHLPHAAATAASAAAGAAMLGGCYDAAGPDMSPLKRKKLSSLLMNRDTPILRTVLGQGAAPGQAAGLSAVAAPPLGQPDSSQPVSLVCHPDSHDSLHSNGSPHDPEPKGIKNEPSEDAQSPYTDISMMDDDDKGKVGVPSSSPLSFGGDLHGVTSAIATYVPQQKPEWKRYKQYTRNDIMSAIEAVRNGMSALQAARKYGVPSRTLYDKVKKLGITTSRPFKRGSNGSSACFPYGISGTSSPYSSLKADADESSALSHTALLEASFLQHALDGRAAPVDAADRDALAAMAAAAHHAAVAAAAAAANCTSPREHGGGGGGGGGSERSPSPPGSGGSGGSTLGGAPGIIKYMRQGSLTPSPAGGSEHHHSETNGSSERERDVDCDDDGDDRVHEHEHEHGHEHGHGHDPDQDQDQDQVEDLSIARKPEPSRVIMPPMNQVSTIMKKEDGLKEHQQQQQQQQALGADEAD